MVSKVTSSDENELESLSMLEGGHESIIEKLQNKTSAELGKDNENSKQKIPGVVKI